MSEWRRPPVCAAWLGGVLLAMCVGYLAWELRSPPPPIDDAFISLRYADHLVQGQGLVWNPGERVEGITNLLWTLLLAALMAVGVGGDGAVYFLASGGALATLAVTYSLTRACLPRSQAGYAGVAPVLLLSSHAFSVWARSGLETPLVALVAGLVLLAGVRDRPWLATCGLIVIGLLRPDAWLLAPGLLWFGLSVGGERRLAGSQGAHKNSRGIGMQLRERVVKLWPYGLALGLAVAAVTAFRLVYYGTPLPNTFYAKVGGLPWETGVIYLCLFLFSGVLLWVPFLWASGWWSEADDEGEARQPATRTTWLRKVVLCHVALQGGYVLLVGGDVFPVGRFFVVLLPGLIALTVLGAMHVPAFIGALCLAAYLVASWAGAPPATFAYLAVAGVSLGGFLWSRGERRRDDVREGPGSTRGRWHPAWLLGIAGLAVTLALVEPLSVPGARFAVRFRQLTDQGPARNRRIAIIDRFNRFAIGRADRIAQRVAQDASDAASPPAIAALAIGRLGYRLPLPIIDVLGLTEPVVAHSAPAQLRWDLLPGHHRSNADYILSREPDVILIPRQLPIRLPAVDDILAHPVFVARYVFDASLPGYRRRPGVAR